MKILKALKRFYNVYTNIVKNIIVLFITISFTCFLVKQGYNFVKDKFFCKETITIAGNNTDVKN